jgi:hypothetical protein
MSANQFANIRAITLVIITLFIMLRSFQVYGQTRSTRLLILGITMIMIALTTTADTIGDNITFHLNSYWFNYFGQTTNYTFFFLSLLSSSEKYLRKLVRWQIALSALLVILLVLGPSFPHSFPNLGLIRAILSSGRAIPCFFICFYYITAFVKKETRFSLLMAAGFLLVAFAYYMIFPRYINPPQDAIQTTGDFLRIIGYGTLLSALLWG